MSRADAVELLGFIGDAHAVQGLKPFTTELLDRLAAVMRCEFASYYRVDVRHRIAHDHVACSAEARYATAPELDSRGEEAGPIALRMKPGELGTWSDGFDRATRRRYEAIPWAGRFELVDCAAMCIGSGLDRAILALHSQERDFTRKDRAKLRALYPHFHALIREARARKRLASLTGAIEAQDESNARGFLLLDSRLEIEQGSPAALRMLRTWFGEIDGHVPSPIGDWLLSQPGREPLRIEGDGKRLVVEAAADDALVMTEEEAPPASLTTREIEVLHCVAEGRTTSEIAQLLWVTPATVSKHLEHIYRKLGVSSRTAALAAAGLKTDSLLLPGGSQQSRLSKPLAWNDSGTQRWRPTATSGDLNSAEAPFTAVSSD